ncbi:hypothetical protein GCM10010451_21560 [Streptomyces virens]|uniref:Uncharacterized protein n=1 Tax=Streptomyces virens TaxID=285572 RepID=A0ABP6PAX1_9ACTN|nr:hypothetical protein GCM10010247_29150 [Streptomyces calvus]
MFRSDGAVIAARTRKVDAWEVRPLRKDMRVPAFHEGRDDGTRRSAVRTNSDRTRDVVGRRFSAHLQRPAARQYRAEAIGPWYGPTGPCAPYVG